MSMPVSCICVALAVCSDAQATSPTIPERIATSGGRPYSGGTLTDLPVLTLSDLERQADLIVVGKLVLRAAQLTEDKRSISSEYELVPSQTLVDKTRPIASTMRQLPPLTVTLIGGEATVNGVLAKVVDLNVKDLRIGATQLMFLAKGAGTNNFGPVGGPGGIFQVDKGGALRSVVVGGSTVEGVEGVQLDAFVQSISARVAGK